MEKEIKRQLRIDLKLDDKKAISYLYEGLYDALGYNEQLQGMHCSSMAIKQIEAALDIAFNSLNKLVNNALKNLDSDSKALLDDSYATANNNDLLMNSVWTKEVDSGNENTSSGFETISKRMLSAIEHYKNNLSSPGYGGARRDAKKYIAGIEMLARYFSETFPDNQLSASAESSFSKYVAIWFKDILHITGKDGEALDIRRHIKNTLQSKAVRLHHID